MSAVNAFLIHKTAIDALAADVQALSADHFSAMPDEIHWGHVGTLALAHQHLRTAVDTMLALAAPAMADGEG